MSCGILRNNRVCERQRAGEGVANPAAFIRSGIPRNRRIRNGKRAALIVNPAAAAIGVRCGIPGNRRIRNGKRTAIVNPAAVTRSGIPGNRRIRNRERAIIANPAAVIRSVIPRNRRIRNGKCSIIVNPAAIAGIPPRNRQTDQFNRARLVTVSNEKDPALPAGVNRDSADSRSVNRDPFGNRQFQ